MSTIHFMSTGTGMCTGMRHKKEDPEGDPEGPPNLSARYADFCKESCYARFTSKAAAFWRGSGDNGQINFR